MTRTLEGARESTRANADRYRCVPCDDVQIVARSLRTSATPQEGPIEACEWIGQR